MIVEEVNAELPAPTGFRGRIRAPVHDQSISGADSVPTRRPGKPC
jgi:hypothetical protein